MSEQAPVTESAPVTETVTLPVATEAKPSKAHLDFERRMEEVLGVERAAQAKDRAADIKLKQAQDLESKAARLAPVLSRLDKGEIEDAVVDLLGDKFSEDTLMSLAAKLNTIQATPAKSVQQQIDEALAAAKRKDEDAAKERDRVAQEARQTEEDQEFTDYMTKSAQFLVDNASQFPLCDSLGVDMERYAVLVDKHIDEKKEIPNPSVIYAALEDEHEAKLAKAGRSKRSQEPEQGLSWKPKALPVVAPKGVEPPPQFVDDDEEQRARLRRYTQEKANQRAMGRS
jgi:hypothetical protein